MTQFEWLTIQWNPMRLSTLYSVVRQNKMSFMLQVSMYLQAKKATDVFDTKTTNEATGTTESELSEGTSEESSTTESLNFEDYTSKYFVEALLKNITRDKIQAFRKVAQILTLLGEQVQLDIFL
ncbi:unnamed protein product [Parnassius apollo]|uniref:(apollo) hypothetical protein n=1 Tax=Parnassius apollo TaxID=110799 RepID=A0A8S3VY68_PARAO|nr:unnamed protein product [Parnassius apollo]